MLCGVALHDELAALRAQVGPQVFDDPVAFRAAFDDFVPEGSASTGEISLLVGAVATGALQRLSEQLALGADPQTSIASQGDRLARDRGTTESTGARWALSVLAHATGAIPAEMVPTVPRPDPDAAADPGPTQSLADVTRVVSTEPPDRPSPPTPATEPSEPSEPSRRGVNPLLVAAVVVLALVAGTAVALLFLRDDVPDDAADDRSDTSSEAAGPDGEVLDQIDLTEAGRMAQVQLVRSGTEVDLVLLVEADGAYTEVDRKEAACPYTDDAYNPRIENVGDQEIVWAWQIRGSDSGFSEEGQVHVAEELLIPFGIGEEPCP
jgi:hypothetical protein